MPIPTQEEDQAQLQKIKDKKRLLEIKSERLALDKDKVSSFDPEGSGYDEQSAAKWIKEFPLTIHKHVGVNCELFISTHKIYSCCRFCFYSRP